MFTRRHDVRMLYAAAGKIVECLQPFGGSPGKVSVRVDFPWWDV